MATEKRLNESPKSSRKKFDQAYFLQHYLSCQDKNPKYKLKSYLAIINRWFRSESNEKPKLLDIGCGYGRFLQFAERDFLTFGIDPSAFVINAAKRFAAKTKFSQATLESFSPRFKFDVIAAFDVLEHIPDLEFSISRIRQLLTPRGIFVCVVPVYDGLLGKIGGLLDHDPTHVHKLNRWLWLKLFRNQFQIIETQGAIRYTLPGGVYFNLMFPWLFRWGQAILVVMKR